MFMQLFGSYLLNNGIITGGQLNQALMKKGQISVKLGVLAINAGYMTAAQVEQVHQRQAQVDKRMGDIATEMGFLSAAQVEELLGAQSPAHLRLGQALVDLGFVTNAQFEKALSDYKRQYLLSDTDFANEDVQKANAIISAFLCFSGVEHYEYCVDYISLLFKSITRFITDDFVPLEPTCVKGTKCALMVRQKINGIFSAHTGFECTPDTLLAFASRYAGEEITEQGEFADSVVGEFMNLHNGLFAVNASVARDVELSLEPQYMDKAVSLTKGTYCILLPISFTFGVVKFVLFPQ